MHLHLRFHFPLLSHCALLYSPDSQDLHIWWDLKVLHNPVNRRGGGYPVVMETSTRDLPISNEQRRTITRILCRRASDAVNGAQQRDQLLIDWDDLLKGRQPILGKRRWQYACELNGTLIREAHSQLLSQINQIIQRDPYWTVEATEAAGEEDAQAVEAWLNDRARIYRLREHLYGAAYNALRDPVGLLYVGWRQKLKKRAVTLHRPEDDPEADPVFAEERDLEADDEAIPSLHEEVESEGCEFRVVDLADFYLYPADCQRIEQAVGVGERLLLTEDDLLDGIEEYGFDEEAVDALIRRGPTHVLDEAGGYRSRKNAADGVSEGGDGDARDGFYEAFLWFGRLPKLRDGDGRITIPDDYVDVETIAVLVPAAEALLRLDVNPEGDRPYIPFYILPEPNRFLGAGVCQLLEQLQEEETQTIRYTIDGYSIDNAPVLLAPKEWINKYGKWSIGPGAMLPADVPGEVQPLQWQRNSLNGLELVQQIRGVAQGVIAAKGYGQTDAKVRKAAEVQNVLAASDTKFDLFLNNFQMGMVTLAERIVALERAHRGDAGTAYRGGMLSREQLERRLMFIPAGSSATASPETRLNIAQMKQKIQMQYLQSRAQAPPDIAALIWHGTRQILLDLGEKRPEQWIGPEPKPAPPPPMPAAPPPGMPPGLNGLAPGRPGGLAGQAPIMPPGPAPGQGAPTMPVQTPMGVPGIGGMPSPFGVSPGLAMGAPGAENQLE